MHENQTEIQPSKLNPGRYDAARMPTDEELDGMEEPPAGMDPPGGGFGDDDAALKGIKRRTSWTGRFFMIAIIGIIGASGYTWYSNHKKEEARWDEFHAADQAANLEAHLAALRDIYPRTEFDDVKIEILKDFQKYKDAAAIPVLITALDDAAIPVRRQAAAAIAAIGLPAGAQAKDKLFERLGKADDAEKGQLVWALAILRDVRAADAIIAEFDKGTLQRQPTFDAKVITDVLGTTRLAGLATNHPSKAVAMLTAMALSEAATPEVVDPLSALLGNADGEVVRQAAAGLGRTGDPRAADKLFEALTAHPDLQSGILDAIRHTTGAPGLASLAARAQNVTVRLELTKMLENSHDGRAADALATLVADADPEIKRHAALGLASLGDPRGTGALLDIAKGTDDNRAREALGALRALARPEMVSGLAEIMNTFPGRKADCLRALAASGSQDAGALIERELGGDDIETAARALADLHYEPAYRHLLGMIHRPPDIDFQTMSAINEEIFRNRLVAIRAVARYGKADAVDTLRTVVEDTVDEPRLREAAGMALGLVAPPAVMTEIVAKIRNAQTDAVVRQYYTQGLWQRPNREIATQLFELLDPATPGEVRRAASLAIGYAADPANDERLLAMLDDAQKRTDAAFAIVLGGTDAAAEKLVTLLSSDRDTRELLQQSILGGENSWFDLLTPDMFTSGEVWRRLRVGAILRRGIGDKTYGFAESKIVLVLKSGFDGPNGMSARQVREKLVEALNGADADLRRVAADTLGAMDERGLLIAARDSTTAGADEARRVLRQLNRGGAAQPEEGEGG